MSVAFAGKFSVDDDDSGVDLPCQFYDIFADSGPRILQPAALRKPDKEAGNERISFGDQATAARVSLRWHVFIIVKVGRQV